MESPDRVLLRCAALISDADAEPIYDVAILIEDGKIASVGRYPVLRRNYPLAIVEDHPDLVALPGLVDAHSHGRGIPMLDHGIADAPLEVWLTRLTAATPLDPYDQALVAAADLVSTGVTSAQVFFHTFAEPEGYLEELAATVEGLKRGGIDLDLVLGISDQHEFIPPDVAAEQLPDEAAHSLASPVRGTDPEAFFEIFDAIQAASGSGADDGSAPARIARALGRNQLILGPIAPQWASENILQMVAERSGPDVRAHTHLLERRSQRSPLYGTSPVEELDGAGILTDGLSVAHGVWLKMEEISLLASRGVTVVHCPGSNTRLEAGAAPVRRLLNAGVPVALGLDSHATREPPDVFAELRHARALASGLEAQISDREAFSLITHGGAVAVGRQGSIGTLRPGAEANVTLVSPGRALRETEDPLAGILAGASRDSVREVMIGGRPVVRNGRHIALEEISAARSRLQDALCQDAPRRHQRLRDLERTGLWLRELWEGT